MSVIQPLDRAKALTVALQLALENSSGALKLKVVELGHNRAVDTLFAPDIINILESEPQLSVSIICFAILIKIQ